MGKVDAVPDLEMTENIGESKQNHDHTGQENGTQHQEDHTDGTNDEFENGNE